MATLRLVHYVHPYGTYLLLPVGVGKKGWAACTAGGWGDGETFPAKNSNGK